ncbi:MAG TPA: hypothetical protein VGM28_00055 [Candidatus Limnocylindrales bacterium]|jgi:hypothetical protein
MSDGEAPAMTRRAGAGRPRRVLAGVVLVLACVAILLSTVAVWVHQVALNTDRFTSLVTTVSTDPEVIDPIADRVSTQVVEALDVQGRLENRLPDAIKGLAGPMSTAVQNAIDQRLQTALLDPRVNEALVNTISNTHQRVVGLLRGDSPTLSVVDGYVVLDVFPVVGIALTQLQSIGIIPPDVQLPDLTSPDTRDTLDQRLDSALGVTLPPTFATIQLMPADRLLAAQGLVKVFDLVVVVLIVVSVALVLLALGLAANRRRMLLYLAIGVIVAFLLARLSIRSIEGVLVDGIADGNVAGAVRALLDATFESLRGITIFVLVASVIVAIVAFIWSELSGRPDGARPGRQGLERIGIGAIIVALVWIAVGPEVALLGAILVIGFELAIRGRSDEAGPPPADAAPAAPDGSSGASA